MELIHLVWKILSILDVFCGKSCSDTGASSGIGAETAIHFAQLGALLSITGRNKHI